MKIFNKWEVREIPEEERVNNGVEGEEHETKKKHVGRKVLIGLGAVAAAVGGAIAIFGRKNIDDEYELEGLIEDDSIDAEYQEVESDE